MLILLNSFRQVQYLSILEGSLADLIGASTLKRLGAYGELDISEQSGYITSYLIITTAKAEDRNPFRSLKLDPNILGKAGYTLT
jgi:hypothetical protein